MAAGHLEPPAFPPSDQPRTRLQIHAQHGSTDEAHRDRALAHRDRLMRRTIVTVRCHGAP